MGVISNPSIIMKRTQDMAMNQEAKGAIISSQCILANISMANRPGRNSCCLCMRESI